MPEQPQASPEQEQCSAAPPLQQIDIRAEIKAAVNEATELALRFSQATHTIGQLEERCRSYQEKLEQSCNQVAELQEQVKLLPAPTAVALLEQRLAQAETELEAEKKKTWWQKLFG